MLRKAWVRNSIIIAVALLIALLLVGLRGVLAPVFMALVLAYIFDPVIDWLEEHNISRTSGIFIIVGLLLLMMLGLALYLIPIIITQIVDLREWLSDLDGLWERLRDRFLPQLETYMAEHQDQVDDWRNSIIEALKENGQRLLTGIVDGIKGAFRSIGAMLSNILSLILVPVLAFYLLRDFDIMTGKMKQLIPLNHRSLVISLMEEMDQVLGNFIKGQLLVAFILSIIYAIGLWIAGTPAFLLIAIIAGFANLVPYLGIALGMVPAVLLTYATGNPMWQVIVSAATFIVGQTLEGMVITPKIVGDSVGLHPVIVMVALMIAGAYFGLTGMILALPVSAVLMVLLKRGYIFYVNSVLYHDGDPPPGWTWSEALLTPADDKEYLEQKQAEEDLATILESADREPASTDGPPPLPETEIPPPLPEQDTGSVASDRSTDHEKQDDDENEKTR